MVTAELINYIQKELKKNTPIDAIHGMLKRHNWNEDAINEGLRLALQDKKLLSKTLHFEKYMNLMLMPPTWELFKSTLLEYKQRFKVYSGIVGITLLISIPLQMIRQFVGVNTSTIETTVTRSGLLLAIMLMWMIILIAVFVLIQTWSTAALIVALRDRETSIGIKEAYTKSRRFVLPLALVGLMIFGLMLLGLVAFIVPIILVIVWYCFSGFVVVSEGLRGRKALVRSKSMVSGRWWRIYWKLVFIAFVTILLSLVVSTILGMVPLPFVKDLGQGILSLITTPLYVIYLYLLYENLKDQA